MFNSAGTFTAKTTNNINENSGDNGAGEDDNANNDNNSNNISNTDRAAETTATDSFRNCLPVGHQLSPSKVPIVAVVSSL